TQSAVYSPVAQSQSKSYAEENSFRFLAAAPRYFCLSNLEHSLLFALRGDRPANLCRLANGLLVSGGFSTDDIATHRTKFIADLTTVLGIVTSKATPQFESVWATVIEEWWNHTQQLHVTPSINLAEPNSPNWPQVRDYFGGSPTEEAARVFLLRCLFAEY